MSKKLYHYENGKRESVTRHESGDLVTSTGKVVNGRVTSNPNAANQNYGRGGHQSYSDPNNPYNGQGSGEWDDYAHTADDL